MTDITVLNTDDITVLYYQDGTLSNYKLNSNDSNILQNLGEILNSVGIIYSQERDVLFKGKNYILTPNNIITLANIKDKNIDKFFYKVIASMLNVNTLVIRYDEEKKVNNFFYYH